MMYKLILFSKNKSELGSMIHFSSCNSFIFLLPIFSFITFIDTIFFRFMFTRIAEDLKDRNSFQINGCRRKELVGVEPKVEREVQGPFIAASVVQWYLGIKQRKSLEELL